MKFVQMLTLFVLLLGPAKVLAGPDQIPSFRPIPEAVLKTCWHYENRARFKTHDAEADLEVILAASCKEALSDVYVRVDSTPYKVKRARLFLERLMVMKALIIELNMNRTFGEDYTPRSKPTVGSIARGAFEQRRVRPVSRTGEYLIAHRLGVIAAYRDWASANGFRSAALY